MNMMIFHNQLRKVYQKAGVVTWSIDDYIDFFDRFFMLHKNITGTDHYNIPSNKLEEIVLELPYVTDEHGFAIDVSPEEYDGVVELYFDTDMDCDYSIYHFMSGDIRLYRLYELHYI